MRVILLALALGRGVADGAVEEPPLPGQSDPETGLATYHAFVTESERRDLGLLLVRDGYARAVGVTRAREPGVSQEEYRQQLRDEELAAASQRLGAWKWTNWKLLPEERRVERAQEEEEEAKKAPPAKQSIDPNTASRDELMRLPGIGEAYALRIIEEREKAPFQDADDLQRVSGIGPKTVEKLAPYLRFDRKPDG